ncbi:MAG: BON domain-containing protein [Thiogranum sp.]|nr:BON domain-containing protein [Thiogranum sp.]
MGIDKKNIYNSNLAYVMSLLLAALVLFPCSARSAETLADTDIAEHVESQLFLDPAVPFDTVDVTTSDGIVTLTGTATSLVGRERAARIATTVRGVRSVVNRIEVEPVRDLSAQELANSVRDALLYDAATNAYELSVTASAQGHITLAGTVDSWAQRQLAEKVAGNVSGVTGISNNIEVSPKANRPDSELLAEVGERLRWDALVDGDFIDVAVDDGKVSLSGTVGSAAERQRAEWDAWVSGVRSVDISALEVKSWATEVEERERQYPPRSDIEIREAVEDALLHDPRISTFAFRIKSRNGRVTLQGVVDNVEARKAAERAARHTVGVVAVSNLLKVRPVENVPDEQIEEKVRSALSRNPWTESYEISVSVKNQTVHLDGNVDSYLEKAEAENTAFRTTGVTGVRNELDVSSPETIVYNPYIYDWSIYDYPWYQGTAITNKPDRAIEVDINNELQWSPFVARNQVTVSVENGVATLTGAVDSWPEYNAARENAFQGGAVSVINKLRVGGF